MFFLDDSEENFEACLSAVFAGASSAHAESPSRGGGRHSGVLDASRRATPEAAASAERVTVLIEEGVPSSPA